MQKYIVIALNIVWSATYAMDNQSIDMMVLKKAGIEALREAIRNSHPPIKAEYLGSFGRGTGEKVLLPGMTFDQSHTIYIGDTQEDPFVTAVWRKIKEIESVGGYHHRSWLSHDGTHVRPTNCLDINTRYWREIDKDTDAPYILVTSRFCEPELCKKALVELGAPYRECNIM